MIYFDTSALVALLTNEPRSSDVRNYMLGASDTFAFSNWVSTEFSAALALKLRMRSITMEERTISQREFNKLITQSFIRLTIEENHFARAAEFARRSRTGLRAGDALHLAIAASQDAAIATLDIGMARAAEGLGLRVSLI